MKKIVFLASILLAASIAQAANLKISVDNRSNKPIIIKKSDGPSLWVPAKTKIENQLFKANEIVTNYDVHGKKKCTWNLKNHDSNEVITGIFYSTNKIFSPGCIVIVDLKN